MLCFDLFKPRCGAKKKIKRKKFYLPKHYEKS